jgi:hypothetical protein
MKDAFFSLIAIIILILMLSSCGQDDCGNISCGANEICFDGYCVPDVPNNPNPCANITCPNGQICINGNCVNSCANTTCPNGQICVNGVCVTDNSDPCLGVTCPNGEICVNGICEPDPNNIACQPCGTFDGTMGGNLQISLTGTDTTFTGVNMSVQVSENNSGNYDFGIDVSALLGAPAGTLVPTVEGTLSGTTMTIANETYTYQGIANIVVDGTIVFDSPFDNLTGSLTLSDDAVGTLNFTASR